MNYLQKKKLAFMSIVNKVKGFVRTVFGVPPITLPDCVDNDSLINYTIEGNSVQDGEPTPEAPIEVESVGDKTKNLFNYSEATVLKRYSSSTIKHENGKIVVNKTTNVAQERITITVPTPKKNTDMIVSLKGENLMSGYGLYMSDTIPTTTWDGSSVSSSLNTGEYNYLNIVFAISTTAVGAIIIYDIQLEEGTKKTSYEPYGYKIPVVCSGKNILNPSNFDFISGNAWSRYDKWTLVKANTKYTFSIKKLINCKSYRINFALFDKSKNLIQNTTGANKYEWADYIVISNNLGMGYYWGTGHIFVMNGNLTTLNNIVLTFIPKQDMYISFFLQHGDVTTSTYVENPQIEVGSKTDYEPYVKPVITNIYLDEPLRKLGNHADYIDFKNQKVVRKVSETILKGTEECTFINGDTSPSYERIYYIHSVFGSTAGESLCNAIKTTNSSNSGWGGTKFVIHVGSNGIFIYRPAYSGVLPDITSKKAWNNFLAERYQNGNPIKLYYILAEAIEEIISIPNISTFKGTTIYSVETSVQPSNMSATYYSTSKE